MIITSKQFFYITISILGMILLLFCLSTLRKRCKEKARQRTYSEEIDLKEFCL